MTSSHAATMNPSHYMRDICFAPYKAIARAFSGSFLERSPGLRQLHRRLMRVLSPTSVHRNGHTIWLDPSDALRLSIHSDDPYSLDFLRSKVSAGMVVVDVGAHIGYYTLQFARSVGPEGHVFAFEPDPDNCVLLRKNITANGYQNVTIVQKAITATNGTSRLYRSNDCSALHRIHPSGLCDQCIEVDSISLDQFFDGKSQRVDLIKLDVEGAEFDVLRGMQHLLRRNPLMKLFIEFVPAWLAEADTDPQRLLEFLNLWDFQILDVDSQRKTVGPVNTAELLHRYPAHIPEGTDLWCIPRRRDTTHSNRGDAATNTRIVT